MVLNSPMFYYMRKLASPEQRLQAHKTFALLRRHVAEKNNLIDARQRFLKKCFVKIEVSFQDTQTDCVQDTAQRKKFKRLKASTAFKTKQTDAEQRRPTIKKLEVKQVEFKLGEDCWEKQVNRSSYC
ncbi:hypothetical protein Tco_0090684 [Tanacetum coccineum]